MLKTRITAICGDADGGPSCRIAAEGIDAAPDDVTDDQIVAVRTAAQKMYHAGFGEDPPATVVTVDRAPYPPPNEAD